MNGWTDGGEEASYIRIYDEGLLAASSRNQMSGYATILQSTPGSGDDTLPGLVVHR